MNLSDIANNRLISQQIRATNFKTAKDIVSWMGAMQAQDHNMAKWAVGVRLPGSTEKNIEAALNKGEIIRTHVLRPTWHLVSADDIHWMLELTGPRIKASLKSRHKQLELTDTLFTKSYSLMEKALMGNQHFSRKDLLAELEKACISINDQRGTHLLLQAELDGIICSGAIRSKQTTYALLHERVPKIKQLTREEALVKLAQRYFTSHCPATLQDFVWWSGLSMRDAKHALEIVKTSFISEKIGLDTYWLTHSFSTIKNEEKSVYLLPAFDELIISYKDRRASLPFENHTKAVSNNGIFWPIIVINGQVVGIWKRTIKKDKILIETHFSQLPHKTAVPLIEKAAKNFGQFLNQKVEISYH